MTLAVLAAATVFFVVREAGNFLVWRYYLNEATKQERVEKCVEEFQKYVFENKLSVNDSDLILEWSAGLYTDIIMYKDSNLVYAPDWFVNFEQDELVNDTSDGLGSFQQPSGTLAPEGDILKDSWFSGDRGFERYLTEEAREAYLEALDGLLDGNRELRPVYFVDGTLLVTVVDYSEEFAYNLVLAIGLIAAFFVLAVVMIFNFTGTAARVNKLAQNVKLVESGNLDLPITLDGNDELTALARDVNSMRNSVVDNMSKERQAWEANTELITAMSHDIRTPLTVLLGYLDLMELQNENADSAEYIAACKENALRLKRLSDDMFSYFLVFGKRDLSLDLTEDIDYAILEQMFSERRLLLEESGYRVEIHGNRHPAKARIDVHYFGRVMDHVFSNLQKYADASEPVSVFSDYEDGFLVVAVENAVREGGDRA
jgi:signal transduction histidine kinase